MASRDFEAHLERAKTRAKPFGFWVSGIRIEPGSVRMAGESARKEAGGSTRRCRLGHTLERGKPMRDAIREDGHEHLVRIDVAGGSNPLKRHIAGCEGAAFGCQRMAGGSWKVLSNVSGGSSGGSALRWKPQEGKAQAERPGPSPATEALKGESQERCGRRREAASREGLRGEKRQGRRRTSKAQWSRGWHPGAVELGLASARPDASRAQDALKGSGTPWEVACGAGLRGADASARAAPAVTGDALKGRASR